MAMKEGQIHFLHTPYDHLNPSKTERTENEIMENNPWEENTYQKSIEDNWWKWTNLSQWKTAKQKINVSTVGRLDISQENVQTPSTKAQQVEQEVIVEVHHHSKDKDKILNNDEEENPHKPKGRNHCKFEPLKLKVTKLKKYAIKFEI